MGNCSTSGSQINSNEIIGKLWIGSMALEISRDGVDCKTHGSMFYKRPVNAHQKNLVQEVFSGHYKAAICKLDCASVSDAL